MRGRELQFKDQAAEMLQRFCDDLGELINIDQPATLQGRNFVMVIGPKKKEKV